MGVEAEGLSALGRVVVAAGRIEMDLALVANELGIANPTGAASDIMKRVKKAVRAASKPLAQYEPQVLSWISQLPSLFDVRHRAIHGVHMKSMDVEGNAEPMVWLMRKNEHEAVDIEELNRTAEKLADLHTEGMKLFGKLHIANLSRR